MLQYFAGKGLRLGGREHQRLSSLFQSAQHLFHAVVDSIFKNAPVPVIFPVQIDPTLSLLPGKSIELLERVRKRRPDKPVQLCPVCLLNAKAFQGIHDRIGDAQPRVCHCSVQIKKNVLVLFHAFLLVPVLCHAGLSCQASQAPDIFILPLLPSFQFPVHLCFRPPADIHRPAVFFPGRALVEKHALQHKLIQPHHLLLPDTFP